MWFANFFYRDQNAFTSIANFSTVLMSYAQINNPAQAVTKALCEQYGLQSAALWLLHPKQAHSYQLISQMPSSESHSGALVQIPAQITWQPVRLVGSAPAWAHQMGGVNQAAALIPLIFEQQLLGWLGVGERRDSEVLLERDLEALNVVGRQITLFIYAAYRRVELEKLNRLLHDTTQQFVYQLGYELPLLEATANSSDERFANRIKRLKWDVMDNSQTLSDILTGKLSRSFDDLEPLLQGFHRDYLPCHWSLDLPQRLDPSLEDEIFFWVKECLNNVWRHARARHVNVHLRQDLRIGELTLRISDDGIGF
jgi:signal transduction histidine kinase